MFRPSAIIPAILALVSILAGVSMPAYASAPTQARPDSRAHFRPGEIIVRFRPEASVSADGASTSSTAQIQSAAPGEAALAFRPAATLLAQPDTPTGLKRLGARLALRAGRPLAVSSPAVPLPSPAPAIDPTPGSAAGGKAGTKPAKTSASSSTLAGAWLLRLDPATSLTAALAACQADPAVLYAEPNYEGALSAVPTDPLYEQSRAALALVGAEGAWAIQPGAAGVTVAVIDSGIDATHPELAGAVDLAGSFNFAEQSTRVFDDIGHGTRVAGLIGAAANNGEGSAGLAHGCRLLSLDVATSQGTVTVADVTSALSWAAAHGAAVANLSLSLAARSQALEDACQAATAAGVLLVAAAGNENQGDAPVYPAAFASVLGVGAVGPDGRTRAPWSNFDGAQRNLVDLVAPGVTLFSTIPGGQYNGSYGSGTSFAAPLVSAAAALLKAHWPGQSAAALRQQLLATAQPLDGSFEPAGGAGRGLVRADLALATPLRPALAVGRVTVDDAKAYSAANNGDGVWQQGETVRLRVELANTGADAPALTATLATSDTQVSVGDAAGAWDALPSGQSALATGDAFSSVTLAAGAPTHPVRFTLNLSEPGGGAPAQTAGFEVAAENFIAAPAIIGQDTTWTADRTYVVSGHSVVMPTAKLTIQPGTTVRFAGQGQLEVRGAIDAQGTTDSRIRLTSMDDKPSGNWGTPFTVTGGSVPDKYSTYQVGDIDRDGRPEWVWAKPGTNLIHVDRLNGTALEPVRDLNLGMIVISLAIGDANNDGQADLVALAYDDNDNSNAFLIHWNGNDFNSQESPLAGPDGKSIDRLGIIADLNNDGKNDITFFSSRLDLGAISLATWDGQKFSSSIAITQYDNLARRPSITYGDVNNDRKNELILAIHNRFGDGMTINQWNGSDWSTLKYFSISYPGASTVVASDVDHDGQQEIVVDRSFTDWTGTDFTPLTPVVLPQDFWANRPGGYENYVDVTGDGKNDQITYDQQTDNLTITPWDQDRAAAPRYAGLWLRQETQSAILHFCDFQFAPVVDESPATHYADCRFDRSGAGDASLVTSSTQLLARCTARGNDAGGGLRADYATLDSCTAEQNHATGLKGMRLVNCTATANGGYGLFGTAAVEGGTARDNNNNGIVATGPVSRGAATGNNGWGFYILNASAQDCEASRNANGILCQNLAGLPDAGNLARCTARDNAYDGLIADSFLNGQWVQTGQLSQCVATGNGGRGIDGADAVDCVAVGNGQGLPVASARRCLAAQNNGPGLAGQSAEACVSYANTQAGATAAQVRDSFLVANGASGAQEAQRVERCAVLDNARGVLGRAAAPLTQILSSTIRGNRGAGVQDAGAVHGCAIEGNGGPAGYDYLDTRPSTTLNQVDLTGNYWGAATTAEMAAHPFCSYSNIARLFDFYDDTARCEANYGGPLQTGPGASAWPDAAAPAFLLGAAPGAADVLGVGLTTFTLTFSKPMDPAVAPSVTFGLAAPWTAHVVEPAPGWVTPTVWQGRFAIGSDTGDGLCRLRVSRATDAGGFLVPDDTARAFTIAADGGLSANNGLASGQGTKMRIEWSTIDAPPTALGFNIFRSETGEPASYQKINDAPLTESQYLDSGLKPGLVYYYEIYLVDGNQNATQWTPPFYGRTGEDKNAAGKAWAIYE